ncbi:ABC transporter substrate-binding protein [Bradyrhizobium canariense]|uniref:Amino acid/amide ABC transporter substrate-binding protein, HAAT family n=1 Tax=Bradyrhizobium canariense TaxID=255045 RepID=A0A1H1T7B8_9BRAD|nr:ABC transporter substrate-binding protein [Bradyrhizobium canariense]SDS56160.1 amino acid/amide ABC transporter substrate-binding protein, HAAT family [Bradyrhizobium canariense]
MFTWKVSSAALALVVLTAVQGHAEPGVTSDTIKIGMFAPMSGTSAIFGRYTIGVRAYYNMINAQGGVNGRKIEVVLEDDACNPATAVAATKRLVSQDGVFAVHGGVCTAAVMAVKKELQRENIPFMNLGAAGASLVDPIASNLFSPLPNTTVVAQTLVNFAMSRPDTKRLAIISHPDDWGKSQLDPAIQLLKDKYKIEFVENVTMERGATDITPQILKLRASKPDVVLSFLYPTETAIFVRSAHKYGLDAPLLGCFGAPYEDTVRRVDDPDATKNLYIFHALGGSSDGAEMSKWVDMIKKYGAPDGAIGDYDLSGIGGAQAMVEALKKAGPDLTREKFIDALNSLKNFDTGVLSAPISFSPDDHAGVKSGEMMTSLDGKLASVKTWPSSKK